ncbi:MAG: DUF1573 domain-containing protein [Alistipes sp.]|nr:DUF1573 domain-containing protein [Alistipes sp.]
MEKFRAIAVTALFTLIYGVVGAQIIFSEKSHDFGEIAEDGGKVEHLFTFRNASAKPVVLVSAHASCGCTKAEFSRKPVMPDSSATVKVVFDPMNYPGMFARKVILVTADGPLKDPLLVTGKVIPRKKSLEERYPMRMGGGVRADANAHSFGYLEHGKAKQSTFELYNHSEKSVSLAIENPYPELEFYLPERLGAGEEATINFGCFLPENSSVYGSVSYSVWLVVDGQKSQYPFILNGMAIDSFEENANNRSQMIAMSENFIKFGAVKCNVAKLSHTIEVRNEGDRAIEIRKVEISKEGFSADIEGDSTIEAGGRRKVKVEIYPSQLPFGAVVERLRIVSNDPKMPVLTIRVSAIVER